MFKGKVLIDVVQYMKILLILLLLIWIIMFRPNPVIQNLNTHQNRPNVLISSKTNSLRKRNIREFEVETQDNSSDKSSK